MNISVINNSSTQQPVLKQGKLPLWIIVLLVVALIVVVSSVGSYFYQQKSINGKIKQQQAGLIKEKQTLLKQADIINTNWLRTLNAQIKNVEGNVVWSTDKQHGVASFKNLPKTKANQHYRLWVYDLSQKADKRISTAQFEKKTNGGSIFLVAMKPHTRVEMPFKFELVLEQTTTKPANKKNIKELPLLLAQP